MSALERCRDCGLPLASWLQLYCRRCVLRHLGEDMREVGRWE